MVTLDSLKKAFDPVKYRRTGSCVDAAGDVTRSLLVLGVPCGRVDGILIQDPDEPLLTANKDVPAGSSAVVLSEYKFVEPFLWEKVRDIEPKLGSDGCLEETPGLAHTVAWAEVDGKQMLIDWSVSQFKSIPNGTRFLVSVWM